MDHEETTKITEEPEKQRSPQSFHSLKPALCEGVLKYVEAQGFTRMTPVQAATIPQILSRKDVAVQAVTGSGKTLAFLISVVEVLLKKSLKKQEIGALILSPTRELALQTYLVAKGLCESCAMTEPLLLVGGASSSGNSSRPVTLDLESFRKMGSDIVIGTPGRVEDVLTKYAVIDCSELECLILDEADVLLNMGFANSLQQILSRLPKMRRTGLFSATTSTSMNSSLQEWMKRAGMRNPVWIDVTVTSKDQQLPTIKDAKGLKAQQQATPSSLTNYYMLMDIEEKLSRLVAFLQDHRQQKIIVFFLTCNCVDFFGSALQQLLPENYIELLHGKMVQKRREKAMERFRECIGAKDNSDGSDEKGGALFSTDVAARGLDVTDVHWVVQFDAPQDPAFFVHRVGRSARAGREGKSLLFLTEKEEAYIDLLQMRKVPLIPMPTSERCCPVEEDIDETPKRDKKPNDEIVGRKIRSAQNPDILLEDALLKVRSLVLTDRDYLEKGTKAYTSYIRAYKEHRCAFIFRFASLDLGKLANAFCLLRLPKMPEIREFMLKHDGKVPHFVSAGPDVDIFTIPFKDKIREQARQKRIQLEMEKGGRNVKQIKAEQRKEEKQRKTEKRRQVAIEKGRNPDKKRSRHARIVDDWDDLAKEERLYKKLRQGKITQDEYDAQMHDI